MLRMLKWTLVLVVICIMAVFVRCTSEAPVFDVAFADFIITRQSILVQDTLKLRNTSKGNVNAYKWTIEDGDPAVSTDAEPIVKFTSVGDKRVTLVAIGRDGKERKPITTKVITVDNKIDSSVEPSFFAITEGSTVNFEVIYAGVLKPIRFRFYEKLELDKDENVFKIVDLVEKDNPIKPDENPQLKLLGSVPIYNWSDMIARSRVYQQASKFSYTPPSIDVGGLYKGVIRINNDLANNYDQKTDTVFILRMNYQDVKLDARQGNQELTSGYHIYNNIFNTDGLNSGDVDKLDFVTYIIKKPNNLKEVVWWWDIDPRKRDIFGFPNILHGIGTDPTATGVTIKTPNPTDPMNPIVSTVYFRETTTSSSTDLSKSFPKLVSFKDIQTPGAIKSFKIKYNFQTHFSQDFTRLFIDIYLNNYVEKKVNNKDVPSVTTSTSPKDLIAMDNKTILRYVLVNKSKLQAGSILTTTPFNFDKILYNVHQEKLGGNDEVAIVDGLPKDQEQSKVKKVITLSFNAANKSQALEGLDQTLDVLGLIESLLGANRDINENFENIKPTTNTGDKFDFFIQSVRMGMHLNSGRGIVEIKKFEVCSRSKDNDPACF